MGERHVHGQEGEDKVRSCMVCIMCIEWRLRRTMEVVWFTERVECTGQRRLDEA